MMMYAWESPVNWRTLFWSKWYDSFGKKSFMPKSDNLNLIPGMYVKIEGKTDVTKLPSDLHICTVAHMHPSPIINTHTHETNK